MVLVDRLMRLSRVGDAAIEEWRAGWVREKRKREGERECRDDK